MRSGNELTLMISYNQTYWDLYHYEIRSADMTGRIIKKWYTPNPVVTIATKESYWRLEVITHTRCFQQSIPKDIYLQMTSTPAVDISNTVTISMPTRTESPTCNGNYVYMINFV